MKRDDGHTASIGRSRRILGALGRVLLGLLLGFVVAEIGSRIYLALPADPDTANLVPDPLAEFRIRPDRPEEVEDPASLSLSPPLASGVRPQLASAMERRPRRQAVR